MKLVATADLHGVFPDIPNCDVLVVAGDVLGDELVKDTRRFSIWLERLRMRDIAVVGVGGNADVWPVDPKALPWLYLENEEVMLRGLRFFGRPWRSDVQPPAEADVVVCHEPPRRVLVKNPLVIYGHIHFGGPRKTIDGSTFANVSCRQGGKMIKPFVFELEDHS